MHIRQVDAGTSGQLPLPLTWAVVDVLPGSQLRPLSAISGLSGALDNYSEADMTG